jgi:isochorismate pyruvate lyase
MQPDPVPPEACNSMAELRTAIDILDKRLVALLAVRQTYVERAAVLKAGRDAVRDPARIEAVVRHVVAEARRAGLSPAIAESVWRTLIEASIAHEYRAFDAKPAAKNDPRDG